jgi:hypothetical protein
MTIRQEEFCSQISGPRWSRKQKKHFPPKATDTLEEEGNFSIWLRDGFWNQKYNYNEGKFLRFLDAIF